MKEKKYKFVGPPVVQISALWQPGTQLVGFLSIAEELMLLHTLFEDGDLWAHTTPVRILVLW